MAKRDTSGAAFRSLAGWAGKGNSSMCAFSPTQTRIPARFRTDASSDDNAYQSVKLQDAILCPTLDGAAGAVVNQTLQTLHISGKANTHGHDVCARLCLSVARRVQVPTHSSGFTEDRVVCCARSTSQHRSALKSGDRPVTLSARLALCKEDKV